ncbi:MAG: DUF3277 family protein [bacterium]|nr:DUF3277 family protein [bacterium]
MGEYKDRVNYKPHNLNNYTVTVDGTEKAVGLEGFTVEFDDDHWGVNVVADGTAQHFKNNSRSGTITIQLQATSTTHKFMWDKYKANMESDTAFSVAILNSESEDFNAACPFAYVQKPPAEVGSQEVSVAEWVLSCAYLDCRGGSYAVQSV